MKILRFGKKEEDIFGEKKEEDIEKKKEDVSDIDQNNIPESVEDNTNDTDYEDVDDIDWDYIQYEYEDLIEHIEDNGWIRTSPAGSIANFDDNIVITKPVKKDTQDVILEIISPEIITICGFNQCSVDEDFITIPNLYAIPHFFTLRCTDDNNVELSSRTIISISKYRNGKLEKLYQEFYGDLSPTINGNFKRKYERYYFTETIILQNGEKLVFRAHRPDIDITKIDVFFMCDLFRRDEEEEEE